MNTCLQLLSKHRNAIMGVAIIAVMFSHLFVITPFPIINFFRNVCYFGVDMFLLLSGFGLYFAMIKRDFSLKLFYKKRFLRIMPAFWIVLAGAYLKFGDHSLQGVFDILCSATTIGMWTWGRIKYVPELWYISLIVVLYAIYPYYYRLFKHRGLIVPLLSIAASLAIIGIYAMICHVFYDNENPSGYAVLAYARLPIFFIGTLLGHWAYNGCKYRLGKTEIALSILIALLSWIWLYYNLMYLEDYLWSFSLYFLPFIIITPVQCTCLAWIFEKCNYLKTFFSYFGKMSLELYLCHVIIFMGFPDYNAHYGVLPAICLVVIPSFISARILYYIDQKFFLKLV